MRERLISLWKRYFPSLPFPNSSTPLKKIDYFLFLVEKGDVDISRIRSVRAYIKGLEIEEFPDILERERIRARVEMEKAEEKKRLEEEVRKIDWKKNQRRVKEILKELGDKPCLTT